MFQNEVTASRKTDEVCRTRHQAYHKSDGGHEHSSRELGMNSIPSQQDICLQLGSQKSEARAEKSCWKAKMKKL